MLFRSGAECQRPRVEIVRAAQQPRPALVRGEALPQPFERAPEPAAHRALGDLEVIETGWDRNRDSRVVELPEFGQITARLWKLLRQESFKAIGKESASA